MSQTPAFAARAGLKCDIAIMVLSAPAFFLSACGSSGGNSVPDGGTCPAGQVLRYESPGCGAAAKPVCGSGEQDACYRAVCSCQGQTISRCDYAPEPFSAFGACPTPDSGMDLPMDRAGDTGIDVPADGTTDIAVLDLPTPLDAPGEGVATVADGGGASTDGSAVVANPDAGATGFEATPAFDGGSTVSSAVRTVTVGTTTCSDGRVLRTTEFPLASADTDAYGITAGPDGNVWFAECFVNKIGRITSDGTVSEFSLPTPDACPNGIIKGPDGNLWFTEVYAGSIGRITPQGTITEFLIPTADGWPYNIAVGPDGNLWFTERMGNKIGRISTQGTVAEFAIPPAQYANQTQEPWDIAAGPDGNLWFTYGPNIGQATSAGTIVLFPVPDAVGGTGGITTGADGNVWFTEVSYAGNNSYGVGRIAPQGIITELAGPVPGSVPGGIAAGPDGNLWFTEDPIAVTSGRLVGRMSPDGTFAECPARRPNIGAEGIAVGPDGNLWLTETGEIIRIEL